MISREQIVAELEKVPEKHLDKLYSIIEDFKARLEEESEAEQSVMARLRQIKIAAAPDFSLKAGLYDLEKNAE